jgi:hypothetical protein
MSSTPQYNLLMFAKIIGREDIAKSVVFATTMWDKLDWESDGDARENVLKEEYWNAMIDHGAAVERFLNTSDSAWSIVDNIVNKDDQKAPLLKSVLFQGKRVDQKKHFAKTTHRPIESP